MAVTTSHAPAGAAELPAFYIPGQHRPDQSVGYLMRKVLASVMAQVDTQLAPHDLTYVQWLPLFKLSMKERGDTVACLAREVDIDPGAMTRSLDRLEAKGLVVRERSTEDRRVVRIMLTEEGRLLARMVPGILAGVLNGHLRGFSEQEWQQLLEFLNRMLANGEMPQQPAAPGAEAASPIPTQANPAT